MASITLGTSISRSSHSEAPLFAQPKHKNDSTIKTVIIFDEVISDSKKKRTPLEDNAKKERDFNVQEIMKEKKVNQEVAEAIYDSFS